MLIEIVQHESNKVVREATLEEAKAFRQTFQVNLVDEHGNRTPFEIDPEELGEPNAADEVNEEVHALRAEADPEVLAANAAMQSEEGQRADASAAAEA